jgi:hypothetical protein
VKKRPGYAGETPAAHSSSTFKLDQLERVVLHLLLDAETSASGQNARSPRR